MELPFRAVLEQVRTLVLAANRTTLATYDALAMLSVFGRALPRHEEVRLQVNMEKEDKNISSREKKQTISYIRYLDVITLQLLNFMQKIGGRALNRILLSNSM